MCQSLAAGGIRCISDTTKALNEVRESGDTAKIAVAEAHLEEATRLSDTLIKEQDAEGHKLIEEGNIKDGMEKVKEAQARRTERNEKIAKNIAKAFSIHIERMAAFVPEFIKSIQSKFDAISARNAWGKEDEAKLRVLAEHEDFNVRSGVAINHSTPSDVLAALAKDDDPRVREAVASNSSTPVKTLMELSKWNTPRIRESLAYNQSTPVEYLDKLAKEKPVAIEIRKALATNPSTPPNVLAGYFIPKETLYTGQLDKDDVNERLAYNFGTPKHTLIKLSKDKNLTVRKAAKRTLKAEHDM